MEQYLLSSIRVLTADDFKDWRRQVRLLFQARPEWQVIAEASDGPEAIQKAKELKPDLIVLDIGLPKLNGIEAARKIRQLSPSSKIVFLSLNKDLEVVRAALGTGALGYVLKTDARSELLLAVDAVLQGKQFVSSNLKPYEFGASPGEKKAPHRHEVQFYSDDTVLLDRLVPFVAATLKTGDAAIVVATESHRGQLVRRLKEQGLDVDAEIKEGRYIPVDADDTLSTFMINDMPDSARFLEIIGGLIEAASKRGKTEHPRVAVFGEWVSLLWAEGKADAVMRLEQLGNQLATTYAVDILCGYGLSVFRGEEDQHVFQSICAEHSAVYSQ
jgi:DNA-binding NarL/FixJ family response regulator